MRAIDADRLGKEIESRFASVLNDKGMVAQTLRIALVAVIKLIRIAPTLDLEEPRPKGYWVRCYNGGTDRGEYSCSVCDAGETHNKSHFCWYCGADMRRGKLHE